MTCKRATSFALLLGACCAAQAAVITVDSTSGAASLPDACTLRAAMVSATTGVAGGTCERGEFLPPDAPSDAPFPVNLIRLPPAALITLTEVHGPGISAPALALPPIIGTAVSIDGRGATIERAAGLACDLDGVAESGEFGLFEIVGFSPVVAQASTLVLADLTLRNGCADDSTSSGGGAVRVVQFAPGDRTRLDLHDVRLVGNRARGPGGAISVSQTSGSGSAALAIRQSVLEANESRASGGGAVHAARAALTIAGSTFASNRAQLRGSALWVGAAPPLEITDSTFDDNQIAAFAPGEAGAAVLIDGAQRARLLHNTISSNRDPGLRPALRLLPAPGIGALLQNNWLVDNNGGNCGELGLLLDVVGGNLSSDTSCRGFLQGGAGQLKPLGRYGGPVPTRPPTSGSAAIDRGGCTDADSSQALGADARVVPRPQDGDAVPGALCDAGAAEYTLNQPPSIDLPPARTALVATPLPLGSTSGAIHIDDPLEHGLPVSLRLEPDHGTVSIATSGLTCTTGDGVDDLLLVCRAPLVALNHALQTLVYTPAAGFIGADALRVEVDDLGAGGDDNLPRGAVADLAITVVASAAQLDVSPPQVDFGDVAIGTSAAPQVVSLRNAGNVAASGVVAEWDGGSSRFRFTSTCSASLAPGASCTLTLQFQPTAAASGDSLLRVHGDGGNGPLVVRVSGAGVLPPGWLFGSSFEDDSVR